MTTTAETFGARLRRLRKQSGLTTQDVARVCRVAESTYREWEYGREIRGANAYEAMAMAFQVSLGELMMGEKGKPSSIAEDLRDIEMIIKRIRLKLEQGDSFSGENS
jgi:transcriptional regulator with XRE-family HTH domain